MTRRRKICATGFVALAMIALAGCNGAGSLTGGGEPALVIANVTVIDGLNGVRDAQTVVVRGDTIAKVGDAASVRVPDGARTIDGTGKYLIPGLWDAHVHLTWPDIPIETSYPLFIANGITSVQDTGGLIDLIAPMRDTAYEDGAVAPRVFIAGPLVDGPKRVYAGQSPMTPELGISVATAAEAQAEIDALNAAGVDLIKLYEMLEPDVFVAAVDHAHDLGLPVTAHVPLSMDAVLVAEAGLDGMQHMRNLEMSCAANASELLEARRAALAASTDDLGARLRSTIHAEQRIPAVRAQDDARCAQVIATLAENDVYQTPTLTIVTFDQSRVFETPAMQQSFDYLDPQLAEAWRAGTAAAAAAERSPDLAAFADWGLDMVGKLHAADIKIVAGTDAPIRFLTPGFSLHQELILLVEAGLTPLEALTAATVNPASFLDLDDRLGTIERGKWADLVLLDADPLADIANTQRIDTVIKAGTVYDRPALDALLDRLASR